ncbi:zinc finger and BTB domain-containing protein 41-like [Phlebotomus argentipes]|uniref:zinc finger and BTB domain-containing protein 41-like n=1 Tax=Phlebotomus argentipes TaxID=94469 RepID=UPI0028932538|nr:zinc finger and BTB domain-containing protein 41-like [Phlebotomus argentipes]
MSSINNNNQILLIKIKLQVLKLVDYVKKLDDSDRKDAIHFILYRISQIENFSAKHSLEVWGRIASGCFGGRIGRKYCSDRRLGRLNNPLKISRIISFSIARRNSHIIRQSSEYLRRYLGNSWSCLHGAIIRSIASKSLPEAVFESRECDEDSDAQDFDDEIESRTFPSDSEVCERKTEKRRARVKIKKLKVPKREIFSCFQCPKVYKKRQNIVDHYAAKHRGFCADCGEELGVEATAKIYHNRTKHLEEFPFVCDICGESMSRNQQFQAHLEAHKRKPVKIEVPKVPKIREKKPKKNRYAIVLPDGVICSFCGAQFPNPSLLNIHKACHHSNRTFQCEVCSMVFKLRSNYLRHKKIHTVQEKKHVCETCGAKYSTKSALKDHTKLAHDKMGFSCEVCGKVFGVERFLKRHSKTHSSERPYACDLCPQTFKIRHHCDRHRKTVHRELTVSENGKKIPEKVQEVQKRKEVMKEIALEPAKELPAATESTILQMISDQIPTEVMPMATAEPTPSQCYQDDFPLPTEMMQPMQPYETQANYGYQENYSLPQDAYIPSQTNYTLNPQGIIEIPPANVDSQLLGDTSFLPQYPYDVWNNQFDCQSTINQQTMPQHSQATYNIGSILTNLELMENNATFDPSYDFFESAPQQQQFYGNGQSCSESEILQWQKMDQYDFNSQNHTLTDISNTFLRDEQRQNSNISSFVNSFGGEMSEEQQIFNANNVNVMLPSLADYLQNHYNPFNSMQEDVEH